MTLSGHLRERKMTYLRLAPAPSVMARMPISPESLAAKLIELGEQHALGQGERADFIGVSDRQYKRWEKGETVPQMPNVRKIVDAYGLDLPTFLAEVSDPSGSLTDRLERIEATLDHLAEVMDALLDASEEAGTAVRNGQQTAREPAAAPTRRAATRRSA